MNIAFILAGFFFGIAMGIKIAEMIDAAADIDDNKNA